MRKNICASLFAVLAALAALSCGGQDRREREASECALAFACDYFNFRYVDALAHVTPDSRRVLELCASNITRSMIDSLRNFTDTPTVAVRETRLMDGDTVAECVVSVVNEISVREIGGCPARENGDKTYVLGLVERDGKWKVRMAGPPRSGR